VKNLPPYQVANPVGASSMRRRKRAGVLLAQIKDADLTRISRKIIAALRLRMLR
jgi:hypothetical protein